MSASSSTFGPYSLLYPLGAGGMGEVFLASQRGEHGIQRLVAIKRMLAHHTRNEKFVHLFLDEVRIASQLNHGNIVQVIDHGIIDGQYYMAMEYIHGENLLELLIRHHKRKTQMPLDLALYVGSEACQGLDHAHNKQSMEGKPLGIVHRDTSPQNILISFQGEVKIADFGVARAAEQTHQTLGGELKGKLAYMSPEQAFGHALDHRSDLFSLGVVLFEALTNRSPFMRDNPMATLEAVRAAEVPSLATLRPELPEEVVALVHRALSSDVDERPDSARSMHDDLQQTMRFHNMVVSGFDLADYMVDLFPESRSAGRATPSSEATTQVGRRADASVEQERRTLFYLRERHPELSQRLGDHAAETVDQAHLLGSTDEVRLATQHRGRSVVLAAVLLAAALGGLALWRPWRGDAAVSAGDAAVRVGPDLTAARPPDAGRRSDAAAGKLDGRAAPRRVGTLAVRSTPPGATVTVGPRRLPGVTPLSARLAPGRHACKVALRGHREHRGQVQIRAGQRAELRAALEALPGRISVRSTHPCRVQVAGKLVGQTPVTDHPAPAGALRVTCVDAAQGVRESRRTRVPPGGAALVSFRFGVLSINVQPWAAVTVDRRARGTTPLRLVLTEGVHRVVLRDKQRGTERSRSVEIRAGATVRISSW